MTHFKDEFSTRDLDYQLPAELIAQQPLPRRDDSRLLIVNRDQDTLRDSIIREFPSLLKPGDLLVLNDTRVLPAKFTARRESGGRMEGLFLEEEHPGLWRVMLGRSRRLKVGQTISLGDGISGEPATILEKLDEGQWKIQIQSNNSAESILARIGHTPLPPYIHRSLDESALHSTDRDRYQTVYARNSGAVAAPTAGLHLTNDLLKCLRQSGVEIAFVTLHVGVGTFKPIGVNNINDHLMHTERYEVKQDCADAWHRCRNRSGRVVAVGTTVVRVLETVFGDPTRSAPYSGNTDVFLHPPKRPKSIDALLTNFHLPRSTLLALVMSLAGVKLTRRAYEHAIAQRYRFFSYGDAMFIE